MASGTLECWSWECRHLKALRFGIEFRVLTDLEDVRSGTSRIGSFFIGWQADLLTQQQDGFGTSSIKTESTGQCMPQKYCSFAESRIFPTHRASSLRLRSNIRS